ncbi:MAG: endo alpha-1,4 polygalactosaminidase [Bacteroidia bacterium]|nr:endo alpha-1,4 polygalactosaminidase [Bacteroidia bacterium]
MKKITALGFALLLFACADENPIPDNLDFRQKMRQFVVAISEYAKAQNPNFVVIPQNGQEIVSLDGKAIGAPAMDFLAAIDGTGREDLFYGYDSDNQETKTSDREYLTAFLDVFLQHGVAVLTTDYCSTPSKMDDSYALNQAKGYISFAAPERDLNVIPDYPTAPYNQHSGDVNTLGEARNFLYIINPGDFVSRADFIAALSQTDYDVIIMDYFFEGDETYTTAEIQQLKTKAGGGKRWVISYMSIGEAEDYRYYWKTEWKNSPPTWLDKENSRWKGNYKVRYWESGWQAIILGNSNAYLDKIVETGFDGVYLDIVDAFEYFE